MALSSLERILSPRSYHIRSGLTELIERAKAFGLNGTDIDNALEALEHNEFGLALDTILVQLFEYAVTIDEEFVASANELCHSMGISWNEYEFVSELVQK